jgi:hypothetical protein
MASLVSFAPSGLASHDEVHPRLCRRLHSFTAFAAWVFAAMVESHGGVRWDGETITKWWWERRPLGLKPVWACLGTRPWKGRSSTVVCGAIVRGWCMRQLGTRRFLRTGWDSFAPSELDFFAARAPTTCVVGCNLSPLRGLGLCHVAGINNTRSSILIHTFYSHAYAPLRPHALRMLFTFALGGFRLCRPGRLS